MKRSELFIKTRREAPADEESKNAQLLIRAGFIHKDAAGVYALLPLGLKVVENIKKVIRDEVNNAGGNELLMTSLQRKELWQHTDRWDDKKVDIWFKSRLQSGQEVGLAWSHEEPITDMMREFIASYRDLPAYVYQFQTKLRNELRAKSGIMRAREFIMKDLYSYSRTEEEHQKFYEAMKEIYLRIFDQVGLGDSTFETMAAGGPFTGSSFSHEFQTVTENGEDTIYLDRDRKKAINEEIYTEELAKNSGFDPGRMEKVQASEVGNIFSFGNHKSEQLGLFFSEEDGSQKPVVLGSYGIGVTRLMGVITEHFADEKGLAWPQSVAPFKVYLASVGEEEQVRRAAGNLYDQLTDKGVAVLYDDRDARPGEKFADADLMGIPYRVVVSAKSLEAGGSELKKRTATDIIIVDDNQLAESLTSSLHE